MNPVASNTSRPECEICTEIHQQGLEAKGPQLTKVGKTVMAVGAGIITVIYGLALPFVTPGFRKICLPFVPATDSQISNILTSLRGRGGSLIDLGSGDGRIVLSTMKATLQKEHDIHLEHADGVELNRWLVWYSRVQVWRNRQLLDRKMLSFFKGDIFKTDLYKYDNIVVFGVDSLMEALEKKLLDELNPNAIVVACRFPMPNWEPVIVVGEGIDKVWVYNSQSLHETFSSELGSSV